VPTASCVRRGEPLAAADGKPLAGRRIVITRAPGQAKELSDRLRELGAEVFLSPMVRFLEPADASALDRAIAALEEFDWLIFTSPNAVRFFLARCRTIRSWPAASAPRIAAVGPATRVALETEGLEVRFMPRGFSGAALAAELAQQLAGKRALLPRSDRAADDLPAALRRANATVTEVVAYRTVEAESLDADVLEAIRRGEADAVTFFSPSAFQHFAHLLGSQALLETAARTIFAAVGPVTAAAIREAGLPVAVEAREATAASFVAALERYFALHGVEKGRP
jgi:uroporphyrinogen-III synthase